MSASRVEDNRDNFIIPRKGGFQVPWQEGEEGNSDFIVKRKVIETLANDSYVDENRIEVKVRDGEVTLNGTVDDYWIKLQIEGKTERILGVKSVNNNIEVESALISGH